MATSSTPMCSRPSTTARSAPTTKDTSGHLLLKTHRGRPAPPGRAARAQWRAPPRPVHAEDVACARERSGQRPPKPILPLCAAGVPRVCMCACVCVCVCPESAARQEAVFRLIAPPPRMEEERPARPCSPDHRSLFRPRLLPCCGGRPILGRAPPAEERSRSVERLFRQGTSNHAAWQVNVKPPVFDQSLPSGRQWTGGELIRGGQRWLEMCKSDKIVLPDRDSSPMTHAAGGAAVHSLAGVAGVGGVTG
jgi:hypothetical protein